MQSIAEGACALPTPPLMNPQPGAGGVSPPAVPLIPQDPIPEDSGLDSETFDSESDLLGTFDHFIMKQPGYRRDGGYDSPPPPALA